MRRKLIRQGGTGLTFYVPKKWIDEKNLKPGDEIAVTVADNKLVVEPATGEKKLKKTQIEITEGDYDQYRSLIGGLYRAGYDEITVTYTDKNVIPNLQKTIDSLYGFEIFDINESSCTIRSVYHEEETDINAHFRKSVQIIKTMYTMIAEDLEKKKNSSEQILQGFRVALLKQRDLISRIIIQKRLFDDQIFPYYSLSHTVWNIGRNYFNLYKAIEKNYKLSTIDKEYFKKTNAFFNEFFENFNTVSHTKKHNAYKKLIQEGIEIMKSRNATLVISYCMAILMLLQSCNSHIILLSNKS
ncbi:MAG: hypothetical protein WC254_04715 [Candidatus Woesearchaeota archaeon]|jgi:phosphate uptake regulator